MQKKIDVLGERETELLYVPAPVSPGAVVSLAGGRKRVHEAREFKRKAEEQLRAMEDASASVFCGMFSVFFAPSPSFPEEVICSTACLPR
jgi:hypothetical protein